MHYVEIMLYVVMGVAGITMIAAMYALWRER